MKEEKFKLCMGEKFKGLENVFRLGDGRKDENILRRICRVLEMFGGL